MRAVAVVLVLPFLLGACATLMPAARPQPLPAGTRATLAVLETTDLHANVLGYDYYKLAPESSVGIERTATLVRAARAQFANTLLLDNGDALQGTALADYQALVAPPPCDQALAIYKAMNLLGVEGGGIGNHEFDYGLPYLSRVTGVRFEVAGVDPAAPRCAGPAFPLVLANLYSSQTGKPLFPPFHIIDKRISATGPDGQPLQATVRVGIIGFAPPAILDWDQRWLAGRVYAEGVREAAQKYLPQLRAAGADLVVALAHGGLDGAPYSATMENAGLYLAQLGGIDALLTGHAHQVFPNPASTLPVFNLPGVDKVAGTVHGVPTVMAGLWGKQLGVIALRLRFDGSRWQVEPERTSVEVRAIRQPDRSEVAADPAYAQLVAPEHAATVAYVQQPLGRSDFRMSSYFADVGDSSAIELVNQAQAAYLADYVKANLPQYAALPVLSMASPFKSGAAGVGDYTDVRAGPIALNHAADLYLYPNTLYGVRLDGAQLKAWLEKSALRFRRIDPALTTAQELVNPAVAGFDFDMLTSAEVRYQIDVTRAPGERIVALSYRGRAVTAADQFLVATNSYRANGGGNFPALDGSHTVLAAPDSNRDVLIAYVRKLGALTRARHGSARSWRFAPVRTSGPVVFHSAPGVLELARQAGLDNVSLLRADDGSGKALYAIDLAR